MKDNIFLIIGLGNPGKNYETTRHNIGFMAIDYIADRHDLNLSNKSKFKADMAQGEISIQNSSSKSSSAKVILCKPMTFMNLSGQSVAQIASYYKIPMSNIIVIHDEIDVDFAKVKTKIGGGSAGHNGIKSIDKELGNKNYHRIRLGVGRPENKNFEISDYVLSSFSASEWDDIEGILKSCEKCLAEIISTKAPTKP